MFYRAGCHSVESEGSADATLFFERVGPELPGDTRMKLLSDPVCRLEKLQLVSVTDTFKQSGPLT